MVDPAAGARELLGELAGEDRRGWSAAGRSQRVRDLVALKERIDAAVLAAVGEWDAGNDWALDGQLSAPTWLAWQTPVTKTTAGRVVADAVFVGGHDDVAALLAAGELSCAHVTAMAKAAKHHHTEFDICKESLLGSARQMNPTDFAQVMASWAKLVDDRPPRQHSDRGFRIRELMDGWGVPDGLLEPELCALFNRCLKDLAPPDPLDAPDGPRTANQRGHDALADLANRHLRGHTGAAPATTADVSIDLATLARHRFAEFLLPAERLPHDLARNHCEIDRRPLTVEDAERLLCDSAVGRLILDADGEVLDAGRQARQFNRAQRRALARRDGGCAFPGCDRPPEWCDAHVRHEAPSTLRDERTRLWAVAAAHRSWEQPAPGGTGKGGSSSDNDGTVRYCQTHRVRQARRNGVRMKEPMVEPPKAQSPARIWRIWAGCSARSLLLGWATPGRSCVQPVGGHGECLRRSRGDAAGEELGAYPVNGLMVNVGTAARLPCPAPSQGGGGKACRRLTAWWRGGGSVVVRGRESRPHGEGTQQDRSPGTGMPGGRR